MSLVSPAVSKLLSTDETVDSFVINTHSHCDLQIFLNIIANCEQEIKNEDKEFLCEVYKLRTIIYKLNSIQQTSEQQISILSSHLYRILSNDEERHILSQLELEIIERILSHEKLLIASEDQLLEFINSLYEKNQESSFLYKYVNFLNCSLTSMQTFLNTFSVEKIDGGIWNQMKGRLLQPIKQENQSNRYCPFKYFPKGSADFDGIINYLRKQTNNQIENEIKITATSIIGNDVNNYGPYNSIPCEEQKHFRSQNLPNSWIYYEFTNHHLIFESIEFYGFLK